MLAGPEPGGRFGIGKPVQLDYREMDTTAQVQVAKMDMGITPNTLEVPFTQLGGNPWKYQASPSKPELTMTLLSGISYPDTEKASKLEQEQYEKLLKEIPLRMSMELKKQRKLPINERDPRFLVLDQLIHFLSRLLAWSNLVADIQPEMYVESSSKLKSMPSVALNNWLEVAEELVKEWVGASRAHDNIRILNELILGVKRYKNSEGTTKEISLKNILKYTSGVIIKCRLNQFPNIGKVTENLLEGLLSVLTALSGKDVASGIWVLEDIKMDLNCTHEGFFGECYRKMIEKLSTSVDELTISQQESVKALTTFVLLQFIGSISEASGIAGGGKEQEAILELPSRVSSFAVRLATHLIANMKVLEISIENALKFFDINGKSNRLFAEIMKFMSLNILILAGTRGRKAVKSADPLLNGVRDVLIESLNYFKTSLDEYESSEIVRKLALAVRQCELAVQKGNLAGYLEAIDVLLKHWQLKIDSAEEESESMISKIIAMLQMFYRLSSQNHMMTVVNQAA